MTARRATLPACPIEGCPRTRMPEHLMCGRHWFKVPKALRNAVWSSFRRRSDSYERNAAAAIAAAQAADAAPEGAPVQLSLLAEAGVHPSHTMTMWGRGVACGSGGCSSFQIRNCSACGGTQTRDISGDERASQYILTQPCKRVGGNADVE